MYLNKWLALSVGLTLGLSVLEHFGLLSKVLGMDGTGITFLILAVFFLAHFVTLNLVFKFNEQVIENLWFVAESLIALGMIGTVVGFTMLFGDAFTHLNLEDTESVMAALSDIASGMGTALITTLVGLVTSLILKFELVFIVRTE